ncbi:hypothetical protein [Succinimonas sp.]|uniref:hypothetical protein n=1 Tax=Succinimonas sp. TaxID=1936151 RepID=UPI00386A9FC6
MKTCHVCGFSENGGKFCNRCGAPLRENGAPGENAKDGEVKEGADQADTKTASTAEDAKAPPPSGGKSMRSYREELPPLTPENDLLEVCFSGHSSGMMYNSDSRFSITAVREPAASGENGASCAVTFKEKKSFALSETIEVYRGYPELLRDIRDILIRADFQEADRRIPDDAKAGPLVFDYSSGYSLSFKWRPDPGSPRYHYFSINSEKITIAKKNEELKEIRDLLNSAKKEECLIRREEKDLGINKSGIIGMMGMTGDPGSGGNRPMTGMLGMMKMNGAPDNSSQPQKTAFPGLNADGSWNCPDCGETGLTGKFCFECGRKRPDNG